MSTIQKLLDICPWSWNTGDRHFFPESLDPQVPHTDEKVQDARPLSPLRKNGWQEEGREGEGDSLPVGVFQRQEVSIQTVARFLQLKATRRRRNGNVFSFSAVLSVRIQDEPSQQVCHYVVVGAQMNHVLII